MNNKKKNTVDFDNLNDVIGLSKKMLKILYACIILAIVFVIISLFKELKVFSFIGSVLKVAAPFFIGLVIAWLLDPVVTLLQKKKVKRTIGAIVVFCAFILVLYLLFRIMLPMLYTQLSDFVSTLPTLFSSISDFIQGIFAKLDGTGFDFTSIETNIYKAIEGLSSDLTTKLPTTAINVVSGLVSSIGTFSIGLIVGFYLLIDFEGVKSIFEFVPKKYRSAIEGIAYKLNSAFRSFVQGTLFISLIVMIISTIGYSIVKLPSPLLFGLICGITNIIPYIGPWIGGVICAIVGFTISPLTGILTALIAFIIQQIDGMILQPLVMGKTMRLHPVTIMIGLLIFGYFFGILGMILATPIMAGVKIIMSYFDEKYDIINHLKGKTAKNNIKKNNEE